MKKIPTLFTRVFEGRKIVAVTDEITPGCEEAFKNGIATVKYDGTCCAIIDGEFYKRYDAKKGKTPPEGAIPCCDPDPVTGHWPHWVKVDISNPSDGHFVKAYKNTGENSDRDILVDGTYECVGPKVQSNPYGYVSNRLVKHGDHVLHDVPRTFEGVKKYLDDHVMEGIVFWLDGEPVCKIKRSDFGFKWP